jgi:hypothetical protein
MITERAARLIESCKLYVEREGARRQREEYEGLRDGLKEAAASLFPAYSTTVTLRDLRGNGVPALSPIPQAGQMKTQTVEASAKFAAAPASLVGQNQFQIPGFKRSAVAVARRADEELAVIWARYVDEAVPAAPADLVELFARIPSKRDAAHEVRRLTSEVRLARQRPPRDRQQLDAFAELVGQLSAALAKLFQGRGDGEDGPGRRDMPDRVREFIDQASSVAGAPVTAATAEVLEWLRDAGIIDAFVVRTASPRP